MKISLVIICTYFPNYQDQIISLPLPSNWNIYVISQASYKCSQSESSWGI